MSLVRIGKSFKLSKKILCVLLSITLCLMLLPSALFRTEAQAAAQTNDDVFVKADSDMTNFGQFAFNPNVSSANVSTYTQNDLLHAIGCKAETENSLMEQVAGEVKAFLIGNKFSPVNDVFPAAKEGFKLSGTNITNVSSQLSCLTVTYDKVAGKAQFATTAPVNSSENGVAVVTAEYAKLNADYDIVFSNLASDLTAAKEMTINTKTCEGKVTVSPTANKDVSGKIVYLLSVDIAIKNINTLSNNINVSVVLNNSFNPVSSVAVNNDATVSVDLSAIIGSQAMREVVDMKPQLVSVINKSDGFDDGNGTTVYLGVVAEHADKILDNDAYKVKNEQINDVIVNTKSGSTNYFALYTNSERTTKYTTKTLEITNAKFNISAPEALSSVENIMTFYDDGEDSPRDLDDLFVTENISVQGTENKYSIADAELSSISFSQFISKLTLKNKSSNVKTGKVLVKSIAEGEDPVIKVFVNDFTFETSTGYKGYKVTDSSNNPLQRFLNFFFHEPDTVKVNFVFNHNTTTAKYDVLFLSKESGKKAKETGKYEYKIEEWYYDEINNEKIFTLTIPKNEEHNTILNFDEKYLVPFHSSIFGWLNYHTSCSPLIDESAATTIVANALGPDSVGVTLDGAIGNNDVVTGDVSISIDITMPEGEGEIFEYTQAFKENDPIATLVDESNVGNNEPETILTFESFSKGIGKDEDKWTASYPINADDNTEHKYTLVVHKIKDLLDRGDDTQNETTYNFSIDKKAPELSVVWNPASPVGNSGNYYNQARTASININEMNFNSSKIKIHQTYTDDYGNKSEMDLNNLNWNTSGFNHTTSFSADKEGDYTFTFEGEDEAGYELTGNTGNVSFTTDWTAPSLNISFDNNSVVNGKYFTASRTATVTVGEHNFDGSLMKVNPIVSPGNDGTIGSASFSGWASAGNNLWSGTISFPAEGTYALTLEGMDMATNAMTPYSQSEFVIDWTKPNIQISGVENRQAYGDTAQPNVTITDANMSSGTTCQVESLGATKGHPYSASPSTTPAQYAYTYGNPEKVPDNDGVYRINVNAVDMAGNSDVKEMVWSVNRFGSTYVIDSETETILDDYVNKDSIKDIVVTEINPSGVDNHSVEMTKGSFTETLKEGEDYTTQASGGDGSWYECIYTINKNFFKEDGKYTLNYYSKDKVGHDNENSMENKNAERNSAVNVQFVYDNAKPTVSYDNLSEGMYSESTHKAKAVFEDNSKKFREGKVIVNGDETYVSGADLEKNGYKIDFELKDSATPISIETVSIDKAGNEMNRDSRSVVVTMNPFLLWFYNTPVFVTTLVVAGLLIIGLAAFLIRRKIGKK